jgi:hypothetical protein
MPTQDRDSHWMRFLAQEPLTAAEENALLRELATNHDFRTQALTDAWLDTALRQHAGSREDFVNRVLSNLSSAQPSPQAVVPGAPESLVFTKSHRALAGSSFKWGRVVAWSLTMAAAVIGGLAILHLSQGAKRYAAQPGPTPPERVAEPPPLTPTPVAKANGFAQLADTINCVWEKPRAVGDRLDRGPLQLLGGTARIAFDGGPVIEVSGPATLDLIDATHTVLRRGKLRTEAPAATPGFVLQTPTSRVIDQGSACELFVAEDGSTEVCVHSGEVDLEQHTLDREVVDRWRIGLGGSKRVDRVAEKPDVLPRTGAFKGVLSVNGQTREFTDRDEYEQARKDAMARFERFRKSIFDAPGAKQSDEPVKSPESPRPTGGFKGQIDFNGQRAEFDGREEFEKAQRLIQEQLEQFQRNFPMLPGVQAGGFKGQINVNGQTLDFDNPKTFLEMQRRMMEQLQQFQKQQPRK